MSRRIDNLISPERTKKMAAQQPFRHFAESDSESKYWDRYSQISQSKSESTNYIWSPLACLSGRLQITQSICGSALKQAIKPTENKINTPNPSTVRRLGKCVKSDFYLFVLLFGFCGTNRQKQRQSVRERLSLEIIRQKSKKSARY